MSSAEYYTDCRYCEDGKTAWDEIATQSLNAGGTRVRNRLDGSTNITRARNVVINGRYLQNRRLRPRTVRPTRILWRVPKLHGRDVWATAMTECVQCGDEWADRERFISLNFATPREERPDPDELVCLRCALVALKGGPGALTAEEREKYQVRV